MTLTFATFLPLLPIIVLSITTVVLMLAIAIKRHYAVSFWISVTGFLLSLISLTFIDVFNLESPVAVTSLMLFDGQVYFYTLLILFSGLVCAFLLRNFLRTYQGNREEVYLLLLIAVIGAMVLVASSHMASFFIGLELLSVPVYGMVAYTYERNRSLEAGIKYLILSAAASAFMLFGMALIYSQLGTLSLLELGNAIAVAGAHHIATFGFVMIVIAMCFKLSLAPFHLWTPDVYQGAPVPVGALLATISKLAVVAILVRLLLQVPTELIPVLQPVLVAVLIISIVVGNLLALTQNNVKRLLAYSSIAHMGYLLIPMVAGGVTVEAINVYLFAYVITTLGAFGAISAISYASDNQDKEEFDNFRGLFWRNPWLAISLALIVLSLAGIPLTAGFIGKFYVFMAAVNASSWGLLAALVIGSGVGLYYYLRLMIALFARDVEDKEITVCRSSLSLVVLMAALVVWFGVYPQPILSFIAGLS